MIITLSGYPGSGKSTVGKLLAQRLSYQRYSIGDLQRRLAAEHGMTLQAWNALEETDPSHDQKIEAYQEELGTREDNFIIDGRISWRYIPHAFKVFLTVDPAEGARRIFSHAQYGDRPEEGHYTSVDQVQQEVAIRIASEHKRYKEYYGLIWDDLTQMDLVIDTSNISPETVVEQIIDKMGKIT